MIIHRYKERMFSLTHTSFSPWVIVRANRQEERARLESIRHVLEPLRLPQQEQSAHDDAPRSERRAPLPPLFGAA